MTGGRAACRPPTWAASPARCALPGGGKRQYWHAGQEPAPAAQEPCPAALLVTADRDTGPLTHHLPTCTPAHAPQYYVSFRTISAFNDHLKPTMGEIELLRLFALADEFKYMVVREVRLGGD